jgi:hypothetical protein
MHGGILTDAAGDEWHLNLRHLVMDQELRSILGRSGKDAAKNREMGQVGKLWLDAITQAAAVRAPSQRIKQVKNLV